MVETLDIRIAGETMRLFADRALFWPARNRLLIADLHLGKGDTFRNAGIAVPSGGTSHDLMRLQHLLQLSQARELWILGDFLHAKHHTAVDAAWREFRECHSTVSMAIVLGNHDRAFNPHLAGIDLLADGTRDGPFQFRHAPEHREPSVNEDYLISGHLHPVLRLPGVGRLPAFWLREAACILPAFSAFTGGFAVSARNGDRLIVCNGQQLYSVGFAQGAA